MKRFCGKGDVYRWEKSGCIGVVETAGEVRSGKVALLLASGTGDYS
jgi:hypothetical protein